jgi:hypothetical protein
MVVEEIQAPLAIQLIMEDLLGEGLVDGITIVDQEQQVMELK